MAMGLQQRNKTVQNPPAPTQRVASCDCAGSVTEPRGAHHSNLTGLLWVCLAFVLVNIIVVVQSALQAQLQLRILQTQLVFNASAVTCLERCLLVHALHLLMTLVQHELQVCILHKSRALLTELIIS